MCYQSPLNLTQWQSSHRNVSLWYHGYVPESLSNLGGWSSGGGKRGPTKRGPNRSLDASLRDFKPVRLHSYQWPRDRSHGSGTSMPQLDLQDWCLHAWLSAPPFCTQLIVCTPRIRGCQSDGAKEPFQNGECLGCAFLATPLLAGLLTGSDVVRGVHFGKHNRLLDFPPCPFWQQILTMALFSQKNPPSRCPMEDGVGQSSISTRGHRLVLSFSLRPFNTNPKSGFSMDFL